MSENVPTTDNPPPKPKSIEGEIVTARGWTDYQATLGIKPEMLQGENVLNFGAGGSNIGKELTAKGISCQVVDLDISQEPLLANPKSLKFWGSLPIQLYLKYGKPEGEKREVLEQRLRKMLGNEGRNYVRYDGRNIPFADQSFDHVLALWSTYQIPDADKPAVYRELLRVGKNLHLGLVFKKDFTVLQDLAKEMDFTMVACKPVIPMPAKLAPLAPFSFGSREDYAQYVAKSGEDKRIKTPLAKDAKYVKHLGAFGWGGSSIVLVKNIH